MSHKSQSIKYSRPEAKRIYHQRRTINRLEKELNKYKKLVEHLKTLKLYDSYLDYDYDDNSYIDYFVFDLGDYINNWFKCEEIDDE